jgi:hypothetical protein
LELPEYDPLVQTQRLHRWRFLGQHFTAFCAAAQIDLHSSVVIPPKVYASHSRRARENTAYFSYIERGDGSKKCSLAQPDVS